MSYGPRSPRPVRHGLPATLLLLAVAAILSPRARALPAQLHVQLGVTATGRPIRAGDFAGGQKAFKGAIFDTDADLRQANLARGDLRRSDLTGVDLTGATLDEANCTHADFRGALLRSVSLKGTDLTGANLLGAQVDAEQLLLAIRKDTIGPDGALLNPSQPAAAVVEAADAGAAEGRQPRARPAMGGAGGGAAADPDQAWDAADLRRFFKKERPMGYLDEIILPEAFTPVRALVATEGGIGWIIPAHATLHVLNRHGSGWFALGGRAEALGTDSGCVWVRTEDGRLRLTPLRELATRGEGRPVQFANLEPMGDGWNPDSAFLHNHHHGAIQKDGRGVGLQEKRKLIQTLLTGPIATAKALKKEGGKRHPTKLDLLRVLPGQGDWYLYCTKNEIGWKNWRLNQDGWLDAPHGLPHTYKMTRDGFVVALFEDRLWVVNPFTGKQWQYGPFRKPKLRVGDVAEGPGGMLWLTQPGLGALLQVDPRAGTVRTVRGPELETGPERITNGGDGRMYFTLDEGRRLGFVVARADGGDPPAPVPPALRNNPAGAPEAAPARAQAKPAKGKPGAAQQTGMPPAKLGAAAEVPDEKTPRADDLAQAPAHPEAETPETGAAWTPAADPQHVKEAPAGPARAAAAAAVAAHDPLADPPKAKVDLVHIAKHYWTETIDPPYPSQFLEGIDDEDQVMALLRTALPRRSRPVYTYQGGWECFYRFPRAIGWSYNRWSGEYERTPLLKIVIRAKDGRWDSVDTAYPVRPFGPFR